MCFPGLALKYVNATNLSFYKIILKQVIFFLIQIIFFKNTEPLQIRYIVK